MRRVVRKMEKTEYLEQDNDGNVYVDTYDAEVIYVWVNDTLVFQGTEDEAHGSYREDGGAWLPTEYSKSPTETSLADAVICFTKDLAIKTSGKVSIHHEPTPHIYMMGDSKPVEGVKGRQRIQIVLPDYSDSSPDHYEWLTGLYMKNKVLLHNCYLSAVNGNMDAEFTASHMFSIDYTLHMPYFKASSSHIDDTTTN